MPRPIRYKHGWRVNFIHRGTRHRRKFRDRERAEEYIEAVHSGGVTPIHPFLDLVGEYVRWCEVEGRRSPNWVRNIRQMLGTFAAQVGIETANGLTTEHIRTFRSWFVRLIPRRSENTWEKYRQALSAFLNWAARRDERVKNVAADSEFRVKVQQNAPETLEPEEVEKIFQYLSNGNEADHLKLVGYRILLYSGLRLGELVSLKWEQVNLKAGTMRVGTKTKEQRTIPIAKRLLPDLKALPRDTVYVLDDGRGQPLFGSDTYYKTLATACARLGLKHHSVHAFRHTFVRYLLERGIELSLVSKIVGHKDIRTTMRYARHFSLERAQAAVDKLDVG